VLHDLFPKSSHHIQSTESLFWRTRWLTTLLMKPRMGKNIDLVQLLAQASKKVVAAATGVVKDWYSSVENIIRHEF
jgi:hypothetical protein